MNSNISPVPYTGCMLPGLVGTITVDNVAKFTTPVKFPWCAVVWADGFFTVTGLAGTRRYEWAADRTGTLHVNFKH